MFVKKITLTLKKKDIYMRKKTLKNFVDLRRQVNTLAINKC